MGRLRQDVRYTLRMLVKNPGFTTVAILTLALGIGANTAIFSVINVELLRPLHFRDPGRLVEVWETKSQNNWKSGSASYPNFVDWRAQNQVFEKIAAYASATYTLTGVEVAAHLQAEVVSADMFSLLGARPELGRTFLPEEDNPHQHVAILSHQLWQQTFGGDPGILGRTITLDNSAYTVVGVMPANFAFPPRQEPVALWTTFSTMQESADNSPPITQQRGAHFVHVIARLKSNLSLEQAQAAMDTVASSLAQQYPDSNRYWGVRLVPEQAQITAGIRPALMLLLVAVGFILLIACVNVANLLLARATVRAREIAIRASLGAGRGRVVRQLLTESLLLSLFAGTLGLLVAEWSIEMLMRLGPPNLLHVTEIHLDGWVLAFTLALALVTGVLFGLAPAFQAARANLAELLKEGALSTTGGSHRHRLLNSLVVVEMALALVLLVSAGLLIRSLARLQDVNPGFNPHNLIASDVDLPDQRYSNAKKAEFFRDLLSRLNAMVGVQSAAAIAPLPMSGSDFRISFVIEGRPVARSDEPDSATRFITPGYFRTMQVPLLAGRDFTDRDDAEATPVVIVNDVLARQFFPGENPIGKRIRLGISVDEKPPRMREIIGVVGNVKFENLTSEWGPESYFPYSQVPWNSMTIVARAAKDPYSLTKPISETVRSLDKDLPTYNAKTVEDYLDGTIALPRFNTFLVGLFAGLALLLTAVGLYGVISYSVAQRTHEIGIRMALGAQPRDMMRHVVGQGLRFALIGVGLGLGAALSLTRMLSSLLFGVQPTDPLSFAGVVVLLLGVVFLACYIPARRAMRVDPMVALRFE